jgi:hypothetical protein
MKDLFHYLAEEELLFLGIQITNYLDLEANRFQVLEEN